jgi:hypothetical protein
MMRISKIQVSQLENSLAESFLDRVEAFIRAELPGAPTRGQIAAFVARAQDHGLTTEINIVTYVVAARLLGHDFEERLPVARALLEEDAPEEIKALKLNELLISTLDGEP